MIKRIRGGIKEKNYKIKNIMREKRRKYMLKRGGKSNEKNQ